MDSILDKIANHARINNVQLRTNESKNWFIKHVRNIQTSPNSILKESKGTVLPTTKNLIGSMYFYMYDPKTKEQLPYYDLFPLCIPIELVESGFYGLNLHYLPIPLRAKLFYSLLQTIKSEQFDSTTKFNANYQTLKQSVRFKPFKACLKRYLFNHVVSKAVLIHPNDWESALFLPVHKFVKKRPEEVWRESKELLRN